ncbi:splicing factor ESS-2 homolog [Physella acuta]|uniref:splicing factor ESS-2 homolog n=1 Tax=Physella acuta TaxID=109671 RepID=UPI0027DB440B|nr:splicing factor ESS-2 homolog [Physella acuta]
MEVAKLKDDNKKVVVAQQFKVPSQRWIKPKKILTEDEFSQGISKIIERDFFPDLPKLEAQAEYYEALEKNDLVKLREIQMRFKRPDTGTSDVASTPATFETPEGRRKTTPAKKIQKDASQSDPNKAGSQMDIEEALENMEEDTDTPKIRLDSFLAKNTSEDSASFVEILKESDRKHRLKHAWLFEKEKEQLAEHEEFSIVPAIEDQAAIEDRPAHINSWKYINENAVMYVPEGLELSAKEMIELQKHKPKEIVHENTRFHFNPFSNARSKEAMQQAAAFKALSNQGKIGHDGKEIQLRQSPQVNGYGFVVTPSPAPGVSESPLMTWGEIESTPMRLDNNNDALPSMTPGPVFRIPDVPKRDRLALELSEKASKAHRAKKEEAIRQVTRRFASPSPSSKLGLSSVERLNSMSPAAQRLASKRLGIKTSSDKALLASYTPSPSPTHRLPGTKTPIRLTPGSRRSHGSLPGSPAVSTPSSERGDATPSNSDLSSLTDHLLKLPQRKRKRAADFFEQQ